MQRPIEIRGIIVAVVLASAGGLARSIAEEPSPGAAPAETTDAVSPEVAGVLERFEAAGRALKTIHCAVRYATDDKLNETTTVKTGTILFTRGQSQPMFLVAFEKTVSDGIQFRNPEWWLFRDRWLWEAKSKSQTIIKRELLAPGEETDFFDLEKSPIPMPFGQTKEQVLKNFQVRLMPPQMGDPENTDHLYCVPREGAPLAKNHRRLEYYVSRDTHLPVRIVAESANGAKVEVAEFIDLAGESAGPQRAPLSSRSINVEISADRFALPAETRDYHVSEEPLNAAEPGKD